jgi:endo-1,4-beta-xylanase
MPQLPLLLSRRQQLKLLGATALAGSFEHVASIRADASSGLALCQTARGRGLLYGSSSDERFTQAPSEYRDLFQKQCDLFAPILSWPQVNPKPDIQDLEWDPNVSFARGHQLKLTGAHLLWHRETPLWFGSLRARVSARNAVANHIAAIVSHYVGQVYSWNVVNEAINPTDGRPDGLRKSVLLKRLGPNFFDLAFRSARAADPSALLVYNEYGLETDAADQEARRTVLLRLLDKLQRQATPIDAIGLQSHLDVRSFHFDEKIYRGFLRDIASRGLKIIISELDVLDIGAPTAIPARDEVVADIYKQLLSVALDEPAVVAVVTWGLSDRYSWYNLWDKPYFRRRDDLPIRPLPFDEGFQPKPAFYALQSALENAPLRPG